MPTLQSPFWNLQVNPEQATFSVHPKSNPGIGIQDAHLLSTYNTHSKQKIGIHKEWPQVEQTQFTHVDSPLGHLSCIQFTSFDKDDTLNYTFTFALPEDQPLFLWKMDLENCGEKPITVDRLELMHAGGRAGKGDVVLPQGPYPSKMSFYTNGWQSWSRTGTYLPDQAMKHSRFGPFQNPMVINPGTPPMRISGYFTSDFYGILCDRTHRAGLLCGFLTQHNHFGSVEAFLYDHGSLRMWANGDHVRLDPGAIMSTDWGVLYSFNLDEQDCLSPYLQAVAKANQIKPPSHSPSGWCSWYQFFTGVTAENIQKNLQAITAHHSELPLELLQIDDGFEAQVGDWFDFKPSFPEGVAQLRQEIQSNGLTPGLWLAPFIVHPSSKLAREHPEFLLRKSDGRSVKAGFCWNTFAEALDLTHPGAMQYAVDVIDTAVHHWGYPYLKLDFLYAAALKGKRCDPTLTRAQILHRGMQAIRSAAGKDTFLLGCGAPLGSVLGLVDAMRIGADVSPDWLPNFKGIKPIFKNEPHFPSARNSIHNILTRAPLHKHWWINDPDCLLIRPNSNLTLAEVQSLATAIALTGGSLLLSDDLPSLPPDRLALAQSLIPLIGQRANIIDLFDETSPQKVRLDLFGNQGPWHLCAQFNWENRAVVASFSPETFHLPDVNYWWSSFWDGKTGAISTEDVKPNRRIPPHGVSLMALYPQQSDKVQYIGSNLHISQGLEVSHWHSGLTAFQFSLELPRSAAGWIDLYLPRTPYSVVANGQPLAFQTFENNRYRFSVSFKSSLSGEIAW